jgi:hypothetical protein
VLIDIHKYDDVPYKQLLEVCKDRGLPRRGNVDTLRDRLVAYDRNPPSDSALPAKRKGKSGASDEKEGGDGSSAGKKKKTAGKGSTASSSDTVPATSLKTPAGKKRGREENEDAEGKGGQKRKRPLRSGKSN